MRGLDYSLLRECVTLSVFRTTGMALLVLFVVLTDHPWWYQLWAVVAIVYLWFEAGYWQAVSRTLGLLASERVQQLEERLMKERNRVR